MYLEACYVPKVNDEYKNPDRDRIQYCLAL